jgi:hypothetical protein
MIVDCIQYVHRILTVAVVKIDAKLIISIIRMISFGGLPLTVAASISHCSMST